MSGIASSDIAAQFFANHAANLLERKALAVREGRECELDVTSAVDMAVTARIFAKMRAKKHEISEGDASDMGVSLFSAGPLPKGVRHYFESLTGWKLPPDSSGELTRVEQS